MKIYLKTATVCLLIYLLNSCGNHDTKKGEQIQTNQFKIEEINAENKLGEIPTRLFNNNELKSYLLNLGKNKLNSKPKSSKSFTDDGYIKEGFESLLGWGFSTSSHNKCGKLLDLSPEDYEVNSYGNSTIYSIDHLTDYQALANYLSVDVSAQFGIGLFGASAQSSYIKDHKMNSYTDYLVARVIVKNQAIKLKKLQFDESLNEEYGNDVNQFLNYSGNEVISEVITGGDLYIIYSFKSNSAIDQSTTRDVLKAHAKGILASANFSAAMTSINSSTTEHSEISVQIIRNGDYLKLPDMNPKTLIDYCINFPELVNAKSDKKMITSIVTTPIKEIRGINKDFVDTKGIIAQQYYVLGLARKKDEIDRALSNIQYVSENSLNFKAQDLKRGENLKKLYIGYTDEIKKCVDIALLDFTDLNCDITKFKMEDYEPVPTVTTSPQPTPKPTLQTITLDGQPVELMTCKPGEIYKVRVDGKWGDATFSGGSCYTADGIDYNNHTTYNAAWQCEFKIKYADGKTMPYNSYKGEFIFDIPNATLIALPKTNTGLCEGIGTNVVKMRAVYWKTN